MDDELQFVETSVGQSHVPKGYVLAWWYQWRIVYHIEEGTPLSLYLFMFFQCFYSIGSHVLSWLTDGSKELGNNLSFNYFSIFILLLVAFQLNKFVRKLVGLPSYRSQYTF